MYVCMYECVCIYLFMSVYTMFRPLVCMYVCLYICMYRLSICFVHRIFIKHLEDLKFIYVMYVCMYEVSVFFHVLFSPVLLQCITAREALRKSKIQRIETRKTKPPAPTAAVMEAIAALAIPLVIPKSAREKQSEHISFDVYVCMYVMNSKYVMYVCM